MKIRAAVLALMLFCMAGETDASVVCEKHDEPVKWAYCVTRTEGSRNPDLVYFFHGIWENETRWNTEDLTKGIQARWAKAGAEAPIVVSVSFGRVAVLSERNESRTSGLLDVFLGLMPEIERSIGWKGKNRLLFGESLGGFNAAQVFLKSPELFARVALACPAITSLSPQAPMRDIRAYMKRTHADIVHVTTAFTVGRIHFPSAEAWKRSDPLALARAGLNRELPPVFISAVSGDQYGFDEGDRLLADAARDAGADVRWRIAPGKHCHVDPDELADFLAPGP